MAAQTEHFRITEHIVPASHIREYAGATSTNQNAVLQLHVKKYTPRVVERDPTNAAVTVIATHGVGLPKKLYEPLWDELYQQSQANHFSIHGIWVADAVSMGPSGVLNEDQLSIDCKCTQP